MAVTGGKGRGQDRAPGKAAGGSEAPACGTVPSAHDPAPAAHDPASAAHDPAPAAHDPAPAAHGPASAAHDPASAAHDPAPPATGQAGARSAGDRRRRSERYRGEQGLLFGDDLDSHPDDAGYRGPTACAAAGITYRQLDYWARTGLVEPSVRPAHGSGSQRLYGFRDILVLKVVKRLLDTGISLQQIRAAVQHLRDHGAADLAQVTLMSDGVSVYECTSADEVVDLLQGGQGVFGIALGRIWREVEGTLADLPAEKTADAQGGSGVAAAVAAASDELAHRRARKTG